jgi:hypothetical protein
VSAELYKAASEKAKAGPHSGTETGSTGEPKTEGKKDEGVIDAEVVDEKK